MVVAGGGIVHCVARVVNENVALDPFPSLLDVDEVAGTAVEN